MAFLLAHDGPGIAVAALIIIFTYSSPLSLFALPLSVILGFVATNVHMSSVFITLSACVALLAILSFM